MKMIFEILELITEFIFKIIITLFVFIIVLLGLGFILWSFFVLIGDSTYRLHAVSRVELLYATCFIASLLFLKSKKTLPYWLDWRNEREKKSDK